MTDYSDERLLAEIALAGILAGRYQEAQTIAAWLLRQTAQYHDSGRLIQATVWHAQQKYSDIIRLLSPACSEQLLPFRALAEFHLGLMHNLKNTLKIMTTGGNNELQAFARQFKQELKV